MYRSDREAGRIARNTGAVKYCHVQTPLIQCIKFYNIHKKQTKCLFMVWMTWAIVHMKQWPISDFLYTYLDLETEKLYIEDCEYLVQSEITILIRISEDVKKAQFS